MMSRLQSVSLRVAVLACAGIVLATPTWAIGTRATTAITNTARVDFTDANGNALFQNSNTVTTIVSQVVGVDLDPNNGPVTLAPGDTYYFAHTVTNTGNFDDHVNLTAVSAGGWPTVIYNDTNNNGTYEAGTDTLLTDSPGDPDGLPDSGFLVNDGFMHILVAVTVPAGTADGAGDVTTVTGVSGFNNAATDSVTDTINITAPNVSVVKSVAPVGNQPPGTVLTYTMVVTNNGTGPANAVVLTDPIPTNTTYQAGTITYNAATRTDGADADNADHNITNPGEITVSIGVLAAGGGTATVTFQVVID